MERADAEIDLLLLALDGAFDTPNAWQGPTLLGSVRNVSLAEAVWRTEPEARNIWEYTLHAAYWKYTVWRRLTGAKRGSFARKGSNWYLCPPVDAEASDLTRLWRADVALLVETHAQLRVAVGALTTEALNAATELTPLRQLILGIAAHDAYHAGQIQWIRQAYRRHRS